MSLQALLDSIPFVAKTGLRCDDYAPGKITLSLPPHSSNMSHAGMVHAGAMFTLAETAGAAACATHPELQGYPLSVKSFSMQYHTGTAGLVVARAFVTNEMARSVAWGVTTTGKADMELRVELFDGVGNPVAEFTALYHLRRPQRGGRG